MLRQLRLEACLCVSARRQTPHHVMSRGIDSIKIFRNRKDREDFLERLADLCRVNALSVYAWALMSDHLLVRDNGDRDTIPKSIQLIAARTGQEFNQRKNRKGAYWEDCYHTTGVETDKYLVQCRVYIDLNMVCAGVVKHPSEWAFSGYNEIQAPRERYALIDYEGLRAFLDFTSMYNFAEDYSGWVEESIEKASHG
jgi:putative transposase